MPIWKRPHFFPCDSASQFPRRRHPTFRLKMLTVFAIKDFQYLQAGGNLEEIEIYLCCLLCLAIRHLVAGIHFIKPGHAIAPRLSSVLYFVAILVLPFKHSLGQVLPFWIGLSALRCNRWMFNWQLSTGLLAFLISLSLPPYSDGLSRPFP